MKPAMFKYKINRNSVEFEVKEYSGTLSIYSALGSMISGYIKNDKFYLQSVSLEVFYFQKDLMQTALRNFNKVNNRKIKIL